MGLLPTQGIAKGFLRNNGCWYRLLDAETLQPVETGGPPLGGGPVVARETFVRFVDADLKPRCQEVYHLRWVALGVLSRVSSSYDQWMPQMPREFECPLPEDATADDLPARWIAQAKTWLDEGLKTWPRVVARPATAEEWASFSLD